MCSTGNNRLQHCVTINRLQQCIYLVDSLAAAATCQSLSESEADYDVVREPFKWLSIEWVSNIQTIVFIERNGTRRRRRKKPLLQDNTVENRKFSAHNPLLRAFKIHSCIKTRMLIVVVASFRCNLFARETYVCIRSFNRKCVCANECIPVNSVTHLRMA